MIHDVAIISAGPCGLAVAARLREATPSALFTDDEHSRYWRRFNRREMIERERKTRQTSAKSNAENGKSVPGERSIVVLDAASNEWMSTWNERFRQLQIEHLRSPLFFHPDPRDRDALLSFAHFHGRVDELQEIHNVAGRELSKHRVKKRRQKRIPPHIQIDDRDRIDYFTPSTELFHDFCGDVVERYGLQNLVVQAKVDNIEYGDLGDLTSAKGFSLTTCQGPIFARIVVLAIGTGYKPCIPMDSSLHFDATPEGVCHCFGAGGEHCLAKHVLQKIDQGLPTWVVVVGGGLSSAQIVDLVIHCGVTKVWLLLRGDYKVKHFDVDLEWVSKVRNTQMSVFWSADGDEERFELLKKARNGGSITPRFDKILKRHVTNNRLGILTHTHIEDEIWCSEGQTWSLRLSPEPESFPESVDQIIYATGTPLDIKKVTCMGQMQDYYPVETINGLPKLTDDLMWHEHVPLFLTGGHAGLRLGPGAGNLAGARQGAERIAWKIEELLQEWHKHSSLRKTSNFADVDSYQLGPSAKRDVTEQRSEYTGAPRINS